MLNQLKKVSRRITAAIKGGAIGSPSKGLGGGLVAKAAKPAAKSAKSSKAKPPAKTALKPAAKAAAKPVAKAAKPAAKAAAPKAAAKPAAKAPPAKAPAAKAAPAKAVKAEAPKVAAKAVPVSAKVPTPGKAAPMKTDKKSGKAVKPVEAVEETLSPEDIAGAEEFAADIASDMESAEVEAAEPLTPSAALLAAMKPTISDEKAAANEKKKKKDDLKLDRNGDLEAQWQSLKDKNKAIKAVNYKMSESFEARTPILHKVLGWGFIITNQNDRLEVLFQQGIKFLISNYKA